MTVATMTALAVGALVFTGCVRTDPRGNEDYGPRAAQTLPATPLFSGIPRISASQAVPEANGPATQRAPEDQRLQGQVVAAINELAGVAPPEVSVFVEDGQVVLQGEVDTWSERMAAVQAARDSGARLIDDQLRFDTRSERTTGSVPESKRPQRCARASREAT